jgi:hypothetical protein
VNGQFEAAWRLHQFFSTRGIPYVVIGGIAVQRWGEPRLTVDADLVALLPIGGEEPTLRELASTFTPRLTDPIKFALDHRVLPMTMADGTTVDVSLALPGFEEEAIRRAALFDIGDGREIRICSAEDLLVYKCVAGRAIDLRDVEAIVARQGDRLDVSHVRRWLDDYIRMTDDPGIRDRFEHAWANRAR